MIGTVIEIVSVGETMPVAAILDEKIVVIVVEILIGNVVVAAILEAVAAAVVEAAAVPVETTKIETVRVYEGLQVLVRR